MACTIILPGDLQLQGINRRNMRHQLVLEPFGLFY